MTRFLKGRVPFTFHHNTSDAEITESADKYTPIEYPKPDGKLTFDLLTSVSRTGTNHDDDEPNHLRIPNQDLRKHAAISYPKFKGIEQRFVLLEFMSMLKTKVKLKELSSRSIRKIASIARLAISKFQHKILLGQLQKEEMGPNII